MRYSQGSQSNCVRVFKSTTDRLPLSKDDTENKEILRWGTPHTFDFEVKDHITLFEEANGLDFAARG